MLRHLLKMVLRHLIVPHEEQPASRGEPPTAIPIEALLDGRECDRVAFEKLCGHLTTYLGPLPAGRLCSVTGGHGQGCNWLAVFILRAGAVHYIRREQGIEPKVSQIMYAWWEATKLTPEFPK